MNTLRVEQHTPSGWTDATDEVAGPIEITYGFGQPSVCSIPALAGRIVRVTVINDGIEYPRFTGTASA